MFILNEIVFSHKMIQNEFMNKISSLRFVFLRINIVNDGKNGNATQTSPKGMRMCMCAKLKLHVMDYESFPFQMVTA